MGDCFASLTWEFIYDIIIIITNYSVVIKLVLFMLRELEEPDGGCERVASALHWAATASVKVDSAV